MAETTVSDIDLIQYNAEHYGAAVYSQSEIEADFVNELTDQFVAQIEADPNLTAEEKEQKIFEFENDILQRLLSTSEADALADFSRDRENFGVRVKLKLAINNKVDYGW
jgi:hypothetical protein